MPSRSRNACIPCRKQALEAEYSQTSEQIAALNRLNNEAKSLAYEIKITRQANRLRLKALVHHDHYLWSACLPMSLLAEPSPLSLEKSYDRSRV